MVNSRELRQSEDHLSKVNFLLKNGIESKVQNYDFTHIKVEDKEKEKEDEWLLGYLLILHSFKN